MALVVKDRVKETTTTTGTGTINLAGAASGFQSFVSGVGDGNTTYYAITDANGAWEVGLGTITDGSPDTLARTTVLATSNGDTSAITLSSGTHTVFATYPAGKAVYLDADGATSFNLTDIPDVSFGGTNLTGTILINNTGSSPLHGTLTGDNQYNVGIGSYALGSITNADYNVALGYFANKFLTTGQDNVSIGHNAGEQMTTGNYNIQIGLRAHQYANDGQWNVAIGNEAMRGNSDGTSTTGNYNNIAIGNQSLYKIEDGDSNVAIGYKSANEIKDGQQNVAVGYQAQLYDETCDHNVAIGRDALKGSSSSDNQQYNTGVGATSLYVITTGSKNTAAGAYTGANLTTGDQNVYLGYGAGTGATATESNMLYIGNAVVSSDGTIIKADMSEKHVAIGMADDLFSNSAGDGTLQIYPKDAADEAIFVKMPTLSLIHI